MNRSHAPSDSALNVLSLTAQQARLLHLATQGLLNRSPRATRHTVSATIRRMQLLQIDTIHVVARSPYLVLFSRVGAYPPTWLEELLAEGDIFEGWSHEACFIPVEDYELHCGYAPSRENHWAYKHAQRMYREHQQDMEGLLAHVRACGPVKATDFVRPGKQAKGSGWWSWKLEKRWLEAWFALGELMTVRRENFHRVYDISERVIGHRGSEWKKPLGLSQSEIQQQLILKTVRALGVTQARWIADYFRTGKKHQDKDLQPLIETGELRRVRVMDWSTPGYIHTDNWELAQRAAQGRLRATHTTVLSPFDPLVWDRARASAMFNFDYTLECYTPAAKRRYGYFVLPILHRGQLIGRLDAKAHRDEGFFEVKNFYLEKGIQASARLIQEVAAAIQACADWHRTPQVRISASEPPSFAKSLHKALVK